MKSTNSQQTEQDRINQQEWDNEENWSGGALGLYFSKKDTRTWVPKKDYQGFGWTLNVGHAKGAVLLFFVMQIPFAILILAMLLFDTTA